MGIEVLRQKSKSKDSTVSSFLHSSRHPAHSKAPRSCCWGLVIENRNEQRPAGWRAEGGRDKQGRARVGKHEEKRKKLGSEGMWRAGSDEPKGLTQGLGAWSYEISRAEEEPLQAAFLSSARLPLPPPAL